MVDFSDIKTNVNTLTFRTNAIVFQNPDGTKVEIGRNDCKNVKIETKDGVLYVTEIK